MQVYELGADGADILLDEGRRGVFRGAVVNRHDQPLRTSLRLSVAGNAQWSWLTLDPSGDIELKPGEKRSFLLAVAVPSHASNGRYQCVLRAVDVRRSDDNVSPDLPLTFEVAGAIVRPSRGMPPVWVLVLIAAAVLAVAAILALSIGKRAAPGIVLLLTAIVTFALGVWEWWRVQGAKRLTKARKTAPVPAQIPPAPVPIAAPTVATDPSTPAGSAAPVAPGAPVAPAAVADADPKAPLTPPTAPMRPAPPDTPALPETPAPSATPAPPATTAPPPPGAAP